LQSAEKLAADDRVAAEHQHAAASSEVAALRAVLEPGTAVAPPFNVTTPTRGRVLRVMRESAGPIAAGTPLLEVGDPSSLEVVVDVLSQDAERISPGMPVFIDTAATQPALGVVTRVEPSAFTRVSALGVEEQRVNVIVSFAAPSTLGDAFRVDTRIILWRGEDVLRVPTSSLFRDHGRWTVYVVHDGRARIRPVDVGHRGRVSVEVTRGLDPGERVIVHPTDTVHDGVRVAVRQSS
jgi:HlyD family secretion protein